MLTVSVALGGMGPDFEASVAKFSDHWFPFPSWTLKCRLAKDADIVVDDIAHGVPWWSSFITRTPVVGIVHHVHQAVATLELGIPLGLAVKLAEKTIKPSYNTIITVSHETKHQIEKLLKVESSRIHVIY